MASALSVLADLNAQLESASQVAEDLEREMDGLKGEMGDKYDAFIQVARRAAKATGVSEEVINKMQADGDMHAVFGDANPDWLSC